MRDSKDGYCAQFEETEVLYGGRIPSSNRNQDDDDDISYMSGTTERTLNTFFSPDKNKTRLKRGDNTSCDNMSSNERSFRYNSVLNNRSRCVDISSVLPNHNTPSNNTQSCYEDTRSVHSRGPDTPTSRLTSPSSRVTQSQFVSNIQISPEISLRPIPTNVVYGNNGGGLSVGSNPISIPNNSNTQLAVVTDFEGDKYTGSITRSHAKRKAI